MRYARPTNDLDVCQIARVVDMPPPRFAGPEEAKTDDVAHKKKETTHRPPALVLCG